MAVLPKGPPSADRATKRSRSPSDRYIIPRLSLQNNDADGEASPRAPLSPRGNLPVAPYAALSSPQPSSDVTKKLPEKISPRFGVPRDENNPEGGRNSVPRLSGGKRSGSCVTARSSSTSKLNSALRESSCGSARGKIRERRPNPLLSSSPPARSAPAPQAGSPSRANQSSRLSCDSSSSSSLHSGPSLVGENVSSATRSTRSVAVTPCASTTSLIVPYAGHRPIPAGSNAMAAHSAGTAGHVASLDCLRGLTSSCCKSLQTSPCHFMCDRLLQQGSLRVKFHRIPHHVFAVLLDIVLLDISSSQLPDAVQAVGKSLGRSWADVQPFLKILEENWYDSMESLRSVGVSDLQALGLPQRFAKDLLQLSETDSVQQDKGKGGKGGKGKSGRGDRDESFGGYDAQGGQKGKRDSSSDKSKGKGKDGNDSKGAKGNKGTKGKIKEPG
eukprot:s2451_g6.t3